jgi:hypothetical protein
MATKTEETVIDYPAHRRERETNRLTEQQKRYGDLLLTGVARGGNTTAEVAELDQLAAALGLEQAQIEQDAADLRRIAELEKLAKSLAPAEAAMRAATKAEEAFSAETDSIMLQRRHRHDELSVARLRAETRYLDVSRELEALSELRHRQWENLGRENPVIASKRRHIAQTIFGEPSGTTYGVISLESFLHARGEHYAGLEIVPVDGQDNFERLLSIVTSAKKLFPRQGYRVNTEDGERDTFVYLTTDEQLATQARYSGVQVLHDQSVFALELDPTRTALVTLPGQSREELEAIATELHTKIVARALPKTEEREKLAKSPFVVLG